MRAAITDPQGPRTWRAIPYLVSIAAFSAAIFGLEGTAAWVTGLAALGAFNLVGAFPLRQRRPRQVEVVTEPGVVTIKQGGTRNQRLRTRDIVGATTARHGDGVLLTLAHARRDQPVTLRVDSEEQAAEIRRALGIGHGGFGVIGWRSLPNDTQKTAVVGRFFAAFVALLCSVLVLLGASEAAAIFGSIFSIFAVIAMIIGVSELMSSSADPSIVMTAQGLRLRTFRGWFALPYDAVLGMHDHARGLIFDVPPPYGTVGVECAGRVHAGLSPNDKEILFAQVGSAMQRARGLGPQKMDASTRLETLRRNGASARDWLMRLDMQGRLLSTAPGYRGNTLDTEDLWTILEDPEAEPELRAAAARVLRHAPQDDARIRIDAAVAAVRDDATNKRLRIATHDDVEAASRELTALEAQEAFQRARRYVASR